MDKLDRIFKLQSMLDEDIMKNRNLEGISAEQWLQKQTLAIISELAELLNEVNFKWWKNPKQVQMDAVKEELADILHFFVGMCLRCGMTADKLYEIYISKNRENFDRQYGRSEKKGYEIDNSKQS